MKRRILLLTLAVLVAFVPMGTVVSYAASNSSTDESLISLLKAAALYGTDSACVEWAFDEATKVDTFSAIDGREYETYLSIGDSTTFGYGIGTEAAGQPDFLKAAGWGKAEEHSWTYLLADKLGIDFEHVTDPENTPWYLDLTEEGNHFAQLGTGYIRVQDLLWLLGDDDMRDAYSRFYFDMTDEATALSFGTRFSVLDENGEVRTNADGTVTVEEVRNLMAKNVENADLITVAVGGNDLSTYLSMRNVAIKWFGADVPTDWETLINEEPALKKLVLALSPLMQEYLGECLSDPEPDTLEMMADSLLYGYLSLLIRTDDLIDRIHEMNPDADVVLVGVFNSYEDIYYDEEGDEKDAVSVGKLMNLLLYGINLRYRTIAEERADWCVYADVSGTEVIGAASGMNLATNDNLMTELGQDSATGFHQSAEGHAHEAELVYAALTMDGPTKEEDTERMKAELREALNADITKGLTRAEKQLTIAAEELREKLESGEKAHEEAVSEFLNALDKQVQAAGEELCEQLEAGAKAHEEAVSELLDNMDEQLKAAAEKQIEIVKEQLEAKEVCFEAEKTFLINVADKAIHYEETYSSFIRGFKRGFSENR